MVYCHRKQTVSFEFWGAYVEQEGGIRLLLESFLGHSEIKWASVEASSSNQESTVCCMEICFYFDIYPEYRKSPLPGSQTWASNPLYTHKKNTKASPCV